MIIKPKIRGLIYTTTHPTNCEVNVEKQIEHIRQNGKIENGPSCVLAIGASTGYSLASRISAAFDSGAATIGVSSEKSGMDTKLGSVSWYNSAAFDEVAKREGLYSKSINGNAFFDECRDRVVELIKEDLGQIDLVVYSLAPPMCRMSRTGEIARSASKPIGKVYTPKAIDTDKDQIITTSVEPAAEEEVQNIVTVMGDEDWELWMGALSGADVLANGVKTVAYSYIGTDLTWPIYWYSALGKAKEDLDHAAGELRSQLAPPNGSASVAVPKSVVTQASSVISVTPLYISMILRLTKAQGAHEGCIKQINRLMTASLYGDKVTFNDNQRIRIDGQELRDDIQQVCRDLRPLITTEDLAQKADYTGYKQEFLNLFGLTLDGMDYDADVNTEVEFNVIAL